MSTKIAFANKALGRYYKLQNKPYNDQFQEWADDNGFDSDGIEEELEGDAEDSALLDIDNNFPGTHDQEPAQIIAILQRCWTDPNAYKYEAQPLKVTADDLKIDDKLIKDTIEIHQKQCKTIFTSGMKNDRCIIKLLAIGQKLGKPYLQFLADMYSRDRLKNKDTSLQPVDWALTNKYCIELKKMSKSHEFKPLTDAVSAITSFFHRILPKLLLNPQTKIVDSLEQTARYIAAAVELVWSISQRAEVTCPFQMDTCIAFNEARDCSSMDLQGMDDDATDDDDDDVDDDDEKAAFGTAFFDCFGNIKKKISQESLLCNINVINDSDIKDIERSARMFNIEFNKFKNTGISKKYKEYPRRQRFCSLIDRRKPEGNNDKGTVKDDEIIFFEPPNNCNTLPVDHHVSLWYFDSSRTCIIPNIGYEDGKHLNDIDGKHDKHSKQDSSWKSVEKVRFAVENITNHWGHIRNAIEHVQDEETANWMMDIVNEEIQKNNKAKQHYIATSPNKILKILKEKPENKEEEIEIITEWVNMAGVGPYTYNNLNDNDDKDDIKKQEHYSSIKERILSQPITSLTPCKGAILVLSFHVVSATEIRAYLYLNGQITRFFPEDIVTILPRFFDETFGNNKDFPTSDVAKDLIERMTPKLKDIPFEAFYNEYKNR